MANANLWRCRKCGDMTSQPQIVCPKAGGWVVTSICENKKCGRVNYHTKKSIPKNPIFTDHRNVMRGIEWLRKMIGASEAKDNMDKVVGEMVPSIETRVK